MDSEWGGGAAGVLGKGARGPAGRGGGGLGSCVSPQCWRSWVRGWGGGAALAAAPPSPRMPPGAPVPGSSPRACATRPCCAPSPLTPRLVPSQSPSPALSLPLEVVRGPLLGKEGAAAGQTLGVFCADYKRLGRLLLEGQRQDKAGWTRGVLLEQRRSPIPLTVGV